MSDSVQPHKRQPTRLPRPWDFLGENTGVSCHFLLHCMKVKSESEVAYRVQLLATPWTAAHQAPPSMGFSRQEYYLISKTDVKRHMFKTELFFKTSFPYFLLLLHLFFCSSFFILCLFSWNMFDSMIKARKLESSKNPHIPLL